MKKDRKILLFPVYDGTITKNLLRTKFLAFLRESGLAQIVILPPTGKAELYKREFQTPDASVVVDETDIWKHDRMEFLFSGIFKHSIPTRFMKIRQVDWYWNQGRYVSYWFTGALRLLGRRRWWQRVLRHFNELEPIPKEVQEVYERWNPDVIFAPTMIPRAEVCLMRLGRKHGKVIVGMAKSFDNLTSKAYLRVAPDALIVPNAHGIKEAVTLYRYPKERVYATGICQYDDYFNDADLIMPREDFLEKIGMDPRKRLLLYAPAGDWMNPTDKETLSLILDWIDAGVLPDTHVLLRLHPVYESKTEELRGRPHLTVERPGKHYGTLKSYEFEKEDVKHLANSLQHADVVINTASTLMVEACIFDTPVIALGFDGKEQKTYWRSVLRYYDREHCVPIVEAGGVHIAKNKDDLLRAIKDYLEKPEKDTEERRKVAETILYRLDGRACERTAGVLLRALRGELNPM